MNDNQGLTPNLPLWSFQIQSDSKLALNSRKDLEVRLITKCYEDDNFKQNLLSTPKSVIENELGVVLPSILEVNVIEQSENTIYMVLPCNPYGNLSEEDLKTSLGLTYEDVAEWCLEQQNGIILDSKNASKIIARAWKDFDFKQKMMFDFELFIKDEMGIKIPEINNFFVLEETSDRCYILLPKITNIFNKVAEFPIPENTENALVIAAGSGPLAPACRNTLNDPMFDRF